MRKIKFDDAMVSNISEFIKLGHTVKETSNKFGVCQDTIRRVMREHGIEPFFINKQHNPHIISDEIKYQVCNLFEHSDMRMQDIVAETKLEWYEVLSILRDNFSQEFIDSRKARLYRNSKLGNKNPRFGKFAENATNYKGIISDGRGYMMVVKPDWYTGRKGSVHVFYHSVVFCEATGMTEIPKGFCVHHIDHNPLNNDISNLALVSVSAHSKLHVYERNLCKVQRLSNKE